MKSNKKDIAEAVKAVDKAIRRTKPTMIVLTEEEADALRKGLIAKYGEDFWQSPQDRI